MKPFLTILFIAGAIGLLWGLAFPQWSQVVVLRDEARALENAVKEGDQAITFMNELLERRNKISEADLQKLSRMIPSGSTKEFVLLELDGIASRSKVFLTSLNFSDVARVSRDKEVGLGITPGALQELGASFTVLGSYEEFRAFLSALENTIRLTDVDTINFSSDSVNLFQFSLQAHSYYVDN